MEQQKTTTKRPAQRQRYWIPGLDGLRAVAVMSVVFYHLNNTRPEGGYIGVDIFFVISGFLITTLLVNEFDRNGKIDLKAFWVRRLRRLIPALVTVILVSVFFALISYFFFRGHDLLIGIGRQSLGAFTFSNNWLEIFKGTSYFNNNSPLLFVNFWSLAVEEQFYLIWPLVVILLLVKTLHMTYNTWIRAGVSTFLGILSAVLMAVYYNDGDATRVYYGTDTHVFGLMFGACLAFIYTNPWYEVRNTSPLTSGWYRKVRVLLAIAAFGLLFFFIITLSSSLPFTYHGGLVLVTLLTAVIIAALPEPINYVSLILEIRLLKWIGQRSYGIYLWHWPIILILESMLPRDVDFNWLLFFLALTLTFVISAFSYTYIEMPVRKKGFIWYWDELRNIFDWHKGKLSALILIPVVLIGSFITALIVAPEKTTLQINLEQAQANAKQAQEAAAAAAAANQQNREARSQAIYDQLKAQAAAAGSPVPPPPDMREGVPAGDEVTAIGDSVMLASSQELMSTFPGIDIDAVVGRQADNALQDVVSKSKGGTIRSDVILAIGTNGELTTAELDQMLSSLGDKKIVLVHAYGDRSWIPGNNQVMDAAAASRANVAVANWDQAITPQKALLADDGIHPGPQGGAVYAKSIADAFIELNSKTQHAS